MAYLGYRAGEPALQCVTLRDWTLGLQAHEVKERIRWAPHIAQINAWTGSDLTPDDFLGPSSFGPQKRQEITSRRSYEELKAELSPHLTNTPHGAA